MDQIIHFSTVSHNGASHRCPVDTGVTAYFHVISQYHITGLLNFIMLTVIGNKAKPVPADDTARLQDIAVPNDTIFPYGHIGIDDAIAAHFNMAANIRMGKYHRIVTDLRTGFHYGKGLYCHIFPQFRIFSHIGKRTDDPLYLFLGTEQFQQFRKGLFRIFNTNHRSFQRPFPGSQDHGACTAFMAELHIGRNRKRNLRRTGFHQSVHPCDPHIRIIMFQCPM